MCRVGSRHGALQHVGELPAEPALDGPWAGAGAAWWEAQPGSVSQHGWLKEALICGKRTCGPGPGEGEEQGAPCDAVRQLYHWQEGRVAWLPVDVPPSKDLPAHQGEEQGRWT